MVVQSIAKNRWKWLKDCAFPPLLNRSGEAELEVRSPCVVESLGSLGLRTTLAVFALNAYFVVVVEQIDECCALALVIDELLRVSQHLSTTFW